MTVKAEAARSTLTYSRMRGMVAILIGECWKSTGLVCVGEPATVLKVQDQISVWRRMLQSPLTISPFPLFKL